MIATFYPGSSIRAQDLNDDFDQLRLAIQEGKCDLEDFKNNLPDDFVAKKDVYDRPIKRLVNGQVMETQNTSLPLVLLQHVVMSLFDQKPPNPSFQQPGKGWQNTDECWSSYWNPQANAWVAYVNTGPRGIPGQNGASADVQIGVPPLVNLVLMPWSLTLVLITLLSSTLPSPVVTKVNVVAVLTSLATSMSLVLLVLTVPNRVTFIIDSNGNGWFWETDTDPATWVDTGTIRGPEGPEGPAGQDGADGDAATIAVDNTVTGPPGLMLM